MSRQRKVAFGPNQGLYSYTVFDAKGRAVRTVYALNIEAARLQLDKGETCRVSDPNGEDL